MIKEKDERRYQCEDLVLLSVKTSGLTDVICRCYLLFSLPTWDHLASNRYNESSNHRIRKIHSIAFEPFIVKKHSSFRYLNNSVVSMCMKL